MKKVIIMVGIPGSGKSTHAESYSTIFDMGRLGEVSTAIVSADNFFINPANGHYVFDRSRLHMAHLTCQNDFALHLHNGVNVVIVDNTNTVARDRKYYIELAKAQGYEVYLDVVECDPKVATARNTHGVPLEVVERMAKQIDTPFGFYQV